MRKARAYGHSDKVNAYEAADLERVRPIADAALAIWRRTYRDVGTCVLGAGLFCWAVHPGQRRARKVCLVPAPGQADGAESHGLALMFLKNKLSGASDMPGVEVWYESGRMD